MPCGGYTLEQVEEVKLVLRLLPVFLVTIIYYSVQGQINTLFVQQGDIMQRDFRIGGRVVNIPAATLGLFDTVAIVAFIPVYSHVVEPLVQRCGHKITLLQRMGSGMVVAAVAMGVAAGIEAWRLREAHDGANGTQAPSSTSKLNVFWQVPQYTLIGLSEVLTAVAMLEFFYDQAPDVMRSCSMALCLLASALGSFLAGGLVSAVQSATAGTRHQWIPDDDLNKGRLDLFFTLLAVLMAFDFVVFLLVATHYEYKAVDHSPPGLVVAGTSTGSEPIESDLELQACACSSAGAT